MYKMLTVCLTLSFIFGETNLKNQTSLKTDNIKKVKSEVDSNIQLLEVSKNVEKSRFEGLNKINKREKKKKQASSKAKKGTPVLKMNYETDKQVFLNSVTESVAQKTSMPLQEKIERAIHDNGQRKALSYIQGPKMKNTSMAQRQSLREHEGLFFSEYAEGSANNKYLEIYNPTDEVIDLSGYAYSNSSNGSDGTHEFWSTFDDGATIAPGGVYIIAHDNADQSILDLADELHYYLSNGDDGYCLTMGTEADHVLVDCIGDFGTDPGSGWPVAGVNNATKDHTLVRKSSVVSGNGGDWVTSAGTSADDSEWIVYDQDTWTYLGSHDMDELDHSYFSENFDDIQTTSDFPPVGWTTDATYPWQLGPLSESSWSSSAPDLSYSGTYCIAFSDYNYSSGSVGDIITPDIDLTNATSPMLYFAYWDASGNDFVDVQVSNSDGTYTNVYDTPLATSGWEVLEVNLSDYAGQVVSVRFVGTSVWGTTNPHIDDVVVTEAPTYPIASLSTDEVVFAPTFIGGSSSLDFAVTNTGGSNLTAVTSSDNAKFAVSALPGRIAPGETALVTVTYSPTEEGNDVGYAIVTHDGDSSPDSVMVSGSGSLNIITEGFDGPWVGDPAAPVGWTVVNSDGDSYTWTQANTYISFDVNGYAAHGMGSQDDWLISPTFTPTGNYKLKWWDVVESATYNNTYDVYVFPGGDITAGVNLGTYDCANTDLTQHVLDLSAYNGQAISVGFHQTFSGSTYYGFGIEDVTVEPAPTSPELVLSDLSLDFGGVFISSSSQLTLTITNDGGADATGTIASDNDKFVVGSTVLNVPFGSSQDIVVTYTPIDVSGDVGSITLTHNGASSPNTVQLSGTGSLDILSEGFDGVWSGDPAAPSGWTVTNSDADAYTWSQSNTYVPEVDGFGAHGMGSQDDWLISPIISLNGGYGIHWWDVVESPSYNNTYDVYVFPNGDITAGVNLGTYDCVNTDLTEHFISLADYNGQDVSIGFHQNYSGSTYYGFAIEDVRVSPLPEVPIIAVSDESLGFMATAIGSSNSKSVSISNSGTGDLAGTVVYSDGFTGANAFAAGDELSILFAPTVSGMITGTATLTPSGGGDAVVISLSGNAGTSVATWDEDLDGDGSGDWPLGWQSVQAAQGIGSGWDFYGFGGHTGDGYASADAGGPGTVNADFLISPKYSVATGDVFSFYASDDGGSVTWPDIMTVHVSTTGGSQLSDFTVELDSVYNMGQSWLPYSYDLSSYVGTEIRLAIVYRGEYGYALNVDDVAGPEIVVESGPVIYDYPTSLYFASGDVVNVGETDTLLFDYFNSGGSDLEVSAVSFEGPFSLSSSVSLPIVTASGSIGSFDVVFSPIEDGSFEGAMTVVNNAGEDLSIPLYGNAFGGVYREDFGIVQADGYLSPWSEGWMFSDDGVMCPTDQTCSNSTGGAWSRASLSGQGLMYHAWNSATDADTAISGAIVLPALATGYHYELDTYEYMAYGADATLSGFAVSTDAGATFTLIGETDYTANGSFYNNYDLTGYAGQTIHIALVYNATFGNSWGVNTMEIRAKEDPIIPVFAHSKLVFPVTKIGESVSRKVYIQNAGVGNLSADITYPTSMTGPASITDLAPGVLDSMVVTYTPSTAGIETGDIVVDGSASGAAVVSLGVEANAGEQAFDLVSRSASWKNYSLAGDPWVSPSGTLYPGIWRWWGGAGHGSENFYGVYSYPGYWGGVDDYLVSPRYDISDASEVLSFFTRGGDDTERDSINVWVSSEQPIMGFVEAEGGRVDTGFVNTDAFSLVFESLPTNIGGEWDPVNIDLSSYSTDVWVMIQSVQYYDDAGEPSGWMLQVDDLGTPDIYMNPNPVLYVGKEYNFGVTQPSGDSVRYYLRNTGMQDLVIDDMAFENGEYFEFAYDGTLPITIVPGGIDSIDVYWMPEMEGVQRDTLVYTSNYTVGDLDAFGRGTDHTLFIADADNAPPNPSALIGPNNGTELVIDGENADGQTQIIWTNATDPDGYPISYHLELVFENTTDTLDTVVTSNVFNLSHAEVLDYMEESGVTSLDVMWNVYTDDSFETVPSSNGPWSLTIDGGWALSVDNNTIPEVFALHNNYPNPFNPVTNIGYDIPELSKVSIDIYNIAGNKVKTLVSKEHQPGRYKVQWNATNESGAPVATGMYIYKIRAKDFVSVKKLLLMK